MFSESVCVARRVLHVDGGSSGVSSQLLSFANPMISDVFGSGLHSSTAGGSYVLLHGSNFGAVGFSTDVRAWATPTYAAPHAPVLCVRCAQAAGNEGA